MYPKPIEILKIVREMEARLQNNIMLDAGEMTPERIERNLKSVRMEYAIQWLKWTQGAGQMPKFM